ncbi:MAG: DUF1292 domain-containing protein [Lachnospiraceae bacterium]|nr:DUF1292 domain-containing protein [Lachnospiraceae bacterium]
MYKNNDSDPKKNNLDFGGTDLDAAGDTVTLTLDDDSVVECEVLNIFTVKVNGTPKNFIALLPTALPDGKEPTVWLYEYRDAKSSNDIEIIPIESDDDYDAAAKAYTNWANSFDDE